MQHYVRTLVIALLFLPFASHATLIFINEFHYDNTGSDQHEFIEVAGTGGFDLTHWSLALYNGSNGEIYHKINLFGSLSNTNDMFGFAAFSYAGIQNGGPDGIALINDQNILVEFISYEGVFEGQKGAAKGIISTDVGVVETNSSPVDWSIQRKTLNSSSSWENGIHSKGVINISQLQQPKVIQTSEPTTLLLFSLVIGLIVINAKTKSQHLSLINC